MTDDFIKLYSTGFLSLDKIIEFFPLIKSLAKQNHPVGQAYLGYCYDRERNMSEAIRLYRLSASQNCQQGHGYLGQCYEQGTGVEINLGKAVEHYLQSLIHDETVRCLINLYNRVS